ncbi:MAG: WGxxGxxG-CTERM domain-containing protein [Cyanobacteria bacterium CRU_2_1]|nr:WGxxGxxG-CTERM domain-containing protein [Cyanobacteria bacterium RU_5_0]NJR62108.1 WGxxGxxG-CTERM domain-containing protein [Cyanobacteria bacterium CRU_2_1]
MKTNLFKAIGIGALSVGLTVLPFTLPASAQDAPGTDDTTTDVVEEDNDFDWGWLGLLGLLGLAGLAGRKRDDHTVYRDPNSTTTGTTGTTGYRQ